jgi:hypothetical protein
MLHRQRAKQIPEAEGEEPQARVQVQDVRRAQDADAAGLQHAVNLAHHAAEILQMLDHLRGGHDIERWHQDTADDSLFRFATSTFWPGSRHQLSV